MLVVLDETIGFHSSSFPFGEQTLPVIKPAKTKKKDHTYQEYIESESSSLRSKNLHLSTYTLEDEIEFFSDLFSRHKAADPIIYFYDPMYTDHPMIRRLQNMFLPDKRLYPLPAAINRAETFFIVTQLLKREGTSSSPVLTYQQLRKHIKSWVAGASGWVVTTNVKSIFKRRIAHRVYRRKKKHTYTQVRINPYGKLESQKKAALDEIWKELSEKLAGKETWVVTKGTELPNSPGKVCDLREEAFPVNVPYVHVFEPPVEEQSTTIGDDEHARC
ncbi:hypothetical protein [Alteribacillus iranensis]|uniref:Uncharacterized protein n=1 Tax=Alteribacillus iranensis TaxID=930128 RepID=A0A1I2D0Q6_9BACI|nr:hypothetical protein [Alteribacillus iranensis]SFE74147.1 hypothetical protein SAMN05192532_103326 [Alteribacillus iranensis]